MTTIKTPERIFVDPTIGEQQAATFAALQELSITPEHYSDEIADTHFQALGLQKPPVLFIPRDRLPQVEEINADIADCLSDTIAEYSAPAGTTIAMTHGIVDIWLRRAIVHSNIKGAGRISVGEKNLEANTESLDTGFYHLVQEDKEPVLERGAFLEAGIARALETEITLAGATPKQEAMVLSDINYFDVAAQGVRTIICKDPSLLDTMLHARSTFDQAAQNHLKDELDRVMGKDFYDTIMQVPNEPSGFDAAKKFVLQRSAEHPADKRIKVDSLRILLKQIVENYQA